MPASWRALQEPVLGQRSRSLAHVWKRQPGPLGDVEQRVLAVCEVEHPQHRHLSAGAVEPAAERSIEAALAELWLAPGVLVDVGQIRPAPSA